MCYSEVELDFAGIHVACLTGENGAGKSALLDGITWALWGNSRLGARKDDDLIRLGTNSMEAEFTFGLGSEVYRVRRRYRAGPRSRTRLDFCVQDGGVWRELTKGGIRATQREIDATLRLDYDTFANSALLRQGHADEFTVKTAAERKRVLSSILRLDRWSTYEDRAREQERAVDAEMEAIEVRLEEIETELDRRTDYELRLQAALAMVDKAAEGLEEARQAHQRIETSRRERELLESQMEDQDEEIKQAEEELAGLAEEMAGRKEELARYGELLSRREQVETGFQAYRKAVESEREFGAKLARSIELDGRRRDLESEISKARHRLEMKRDTLVQGIDRLVGQIPDDALLEEQRDLEAHVEHLRQLAASREAAKDDVTRLAERRAQLTVENEGLRREMEALKERIGLLREADAMCPLCEQPMSEDHRLELVDEMEREGKAKGDRYRANQAEVERIAAQSLALDEQIIQSDGSLQSLPSLQRESAAINERLARGRQAAEELERLRIELADVEGRLTEGEYACEVRAKLEAVLAEVEELGYDLEAHQEARQAAAEGESFAELKGKLDSIQEQMTAERQAHQRLKESAGRWEERLSLARERRTRLEGEIDGLLAAIEKGDAVEAELQKMRGEEAEARHELGASRQRLAACEALGQQRADKLKRKNELVAQKSIYAELIAAFGVNGVPAMIIEATVPEIELETNRLLSLLTDDRMRVRFQTQRRTKTGEPREALQIQISDEAGTRPYENYSGGEQFRVDLAIRLALSKLLVRRSGAQLETLVIDEGFGTQDARGRQRLVEAINAVQDEFARVLVVTHIDELKTAFPAHIEVTKSPQGSTVEVLPRQ